jgi:hypothetical protein
MIAAIVFFLLPDLFYQLNTATVSLCPTGKNNQLLIAPYSPQGERMEDHKEEGKRRAGTEKERAGMGACPYGNVRQTAGAA